MIPNMWLFTHKSEFDKKAEISSAYVGLSKLQAEKKMLSKYDFEL